MERNKHGYSQRADVFTVPGKVEEVNMPRIKEWLRNITDVLHEIHLGKKKTHCNLAQSLNTK